MGGRVAVQAERMEGGVTMPQAMVTITRSVIQRRRRRAGTERGEARGGG